MTAILKSYNVGRIKKPPPEKRYSEVIKKWEEGLEWKHQKNLSSYYFINTPITDQICAF